MTAATSRQVNADWRRRIGSKYFVPKPLPHERKSAD
jgi:hypothetical protein